MASKVKILFIAVILSLFSLPSFADKYNLGLDYALYTPKNFGEFRKVANVQNYSEITTGYRNSCGPMTMLFIHNYYTYKKQGRPDDLSKSVASVKAAIERQYNKTMGLRNNVYTDFDNLKALGRSWGWSSVRKSNKSGFDGSPNLYEFIKRKLTENKFVVVNLEKNSILTKDLFRNVQHFITITAVIEHRNGTINIVYFDPWDGKLKTTTYDNLRKSWIGTHNVLTINGN
ncbi:hypothetical protein DLH72_01375 [Candidatus Gracilibacteria bacterium]|nr:MAG: hypothetical protein DLH72_01375 [Candidatus Gracilibacteria bacterium]